MRRAAVVLALIAAIVAGCGLDPSPSPSSSAVATRSAAAPAATPTASAAPATSAASAGGSGSPPVAADAALITSVLGGSQAGLTFAYDEETTSQVLADPGIRKDASALAIGLYTVTGQQPIEDYAIVNVLRLRDPGTADDNWFRSYRDSYDDSACAQAGGVTRHAEAQMSSHTVFIGSCAGGAFTYHLRTKTGDLVVSITGVGPGRLGERLAAAVTDP